jgi:hypothetical protein
MKKQEIKSIFSNSIEGCQINLSAAEMMSLRELSHKLEKLSMDETVEGKRRSLRDAYTFLSKISTGISMDISVREELFCFHALRERN